MPDVRNGEPKFTMTSANPRPNSCFRTHVLSTLAKCSSLSHLKQLQSHLLALGHAQTQLFSFKLVRFCSMVLFDCRYARLIFDSLVSPNVHLYTAMITAYSSRCDPISAFHLFGRMLHPDHPKPNEFVYPLALKSCGDVADVGLVRTVDGLVWKTGFEGFGVVKTALVDGYSRCGETQTARKLFDELGDRNVVSWTVMVSAYMRGGSIGNAICLFDEMPERDVPAWNAVIAGCTQNGFFLEAIGLFRRMILTGGLPNQTTVACMLSSCGQLGTLQLGQSIHGCIYKKHISLNSFVSNALVDMYGKCGRLKIAMWIFGKLSDRSLTAWNSMINCLALHGQSKDAIAMFEEMQASGQRPDRVTFVGLLNACTHGGLVDEGNNYFGSMTHKYGFEPQIEHYGCVIDLLGRAGRFREAMNIISNMAVEPDEVVWGSLLNGCRIHRNIKLALFAIQKLLEIDPANVDYRVMLANLYSESGKWEDVGNLRKLMAEKGRKKLPGCSWIEVEGDVHQFYSGDQTHSQAEEIYELLEGLCWVF